MIANREGPYYGHRCIVESSLLSSLQESIRFVTDHKVGEQAGQPMMNVAPA